MGTLALVFLSSSRMEKVSCARLSLSSSPTANIMTGRLSLRMLASA